MTGTGAICRLVTVEGLVQGVGYREFTRRAALRLGIAGWVRNRSDGAVEALLRGSSMEVEAMVAEMRQGPRFAVVDALRVIEHGDAPATGEGGTFVIRPTK